MYLNTFNNVLAYAHINQLMKKKKKNKNILKINEKTRTKRNTGRAISLYFAHQIIA